ncbi:Ribosome biogenesis protein Nop53/GLTSCR2 [Rhypophila decipiens]
MPVLKAPSGNPNGPAQYKQPSRKGKKAWRKNVDVTDVEKGLDELNDEIILHGEKIGEKASEDLFAIDVKGDSNITKKLPKALTKKLKADEIIAARSAVPAVSLRKRPGDKTTDGVLPVKRQRTQYVTQKELVRLRKVADGQHETTVTVTDATYDVWDAPDPQKEVTEKLPFLPKVDKAKVPNTLRQQPISLSANGKPVPAVPKPSGGYSYNPEFNDYRDRLEEVSNQVVEGEKKRLAELEAERLRQIAAAKSAAEAEAAEARKDLSEWEEESAWEGIESGGEELVAGAISKKKKERKTQAQRNKIKRRKEAERLAKHEAAMKKKRQQLEKISELAEEVYQKEKAMEVAKIEMSDDSEGDDEVLRRRQLGKFRLPEKDLEIVLPDELEESLRRLKPEGNLLKDRFRNMLVRGKLESRRKIPFKKQAKGKITEKWSYKDFVLD